MATSLASRTSEYARSPPCSYCMVHNLDCVSHRIQSRQFPVSKVLFMATYRIDLVDDHPQVMIIAWDARWFTRPIGPSWRQSLVL